MAREGKATNLNLNDLARICTEETELFFQHRDHDTRYCFELFRRAIRENDQTAWEIIFNQYQSLVTGWVRQHQGFESSGEEAQFFVTEAFAKISSILTSEKFDKFSNLKALLSYLKMCVHSVITDYNRKADQANLQVSFEEIQIDIKSSDPAPESTVLDKLDKHTLWTQLIDRLNDEKERLVMQGVFVLALKPRELCDYYEGTFENVEEVYRIKQNIFARLRRDSEFRELFGMDD
jgi:DNA-directed RNA polymerase specialized sigma24 family protein